VITFSLDFVSVQLIFTIIRYHNHISKAFSLRIQKLNSTTDLR